MYNCSLYLNQLIQDGSDIFAISEHWLWPYQLHFLNTIHPDFVGLGLSDNCLNKDSDLNCGCWGVGFVWRHSIMANSFTSDRFCAIQLPLTQCQTAESYLFTIICVYLPSSDHSLNELSDDVSELESAVSALEPSSPVMLTGDFNAHLPKDGTLDNGNLQGRLLLDMIHNHNLFVSSTSCFSKGPSYTFFSGTN